MRNLLASSSLPNAPLLFIPVRLYKKDTHFSPCTSFTVSSNIYPRSGPPLIYAVRLVFIHFLACSPCRKSRPTFMSCRRDPPEKYLTVMARHQLFRGLLKTAVSICTPLGFPGGELCRRKVWAYTQSCPRYTRTTLPSRPSRSRPPLYLILRPSRILPSLSLFLHLRRPFPSHLRVALPCSHPLPRPLLARPSMLLLAPAVSLSFSPSRVFSVRFHPRPSTFRVYRTIARAPITVTGRATSWLAVDVGGGRTADRRRRGRRRRRRRRRGRAQQTISEIRRATKRNSSSADGVISHSRYVPKEVCALCCCLRRSLSPPRKPSIRESTWGDSTSAAS